MKDLESKNSDLRSRLDRMLKLSSRGGTASGGPITSGKGKSVPSSRIQNDDEVGDIGSYEDDISNNEDQALVNEERLQKHGNQTPGRLTPSVVTPAKASSSSRQPAVSTNQPPPPPSGGTNNTPIHATNRSRLTATTTTTSTSGGVPRDVVVDWSKASRWIEDKVAARLAEYVGAFGVIAVIVAVVLFL